MKLLKLESLEEEPCGVAQTSEQGLCLAGAGASEAALGLVL